MMVLREFTVKLVLVTGEITDEVANIKDDTITELDLPSQIESMVRKILGRPALGLENVIVTVTEDEEGF